MSEFQEFKAFEKAGWEERATGYATLMESVTGSLMSSFVDYLEPVAGLRTLELASGPGFGAAEIAKRGGDVLGTDFAEAMVVEASLLYPNLAFQQEDAENLSFDDDTFDLALCSFGMLHFAHPEQALSEVFRVLKPGGKFTFTVWAPPEDYPIFGLLAEAVTECGSLDVGLPPGPPAEAFSIIDGARNAVEAAGFDFESFVEVDTKLSLCPASDIINFYSEVSVRAQGILEAQPADKRKAVEEALVRRYEQFEVDGVVLLPMPHRIVTAIKPLDS